VEGDVEGTSAPKRCSARARPVFLTPRWPRTRAATCNHQLAPCVSRRRDERLFGQRAGAVPPAVREFRAGLATVPAGSWKVSGDVGYGDGAAPPEWVWSSQLCQNPQRWENCFGMSGPASPGRSMGGGPSPLGPAQGAGKGWLGVDSTASALALALLWLSARDWGCQEGPSPPRILEAPLLGNPSFSFLLRLWAMGEPSEPPSQILPC